MIGMAKRFWVSWWSGYYEDEGCTEPPFQAWVTAQMDRADTKETGRDLKAFCAVIDAELEGDIWPVVAKHFPDYQERFCEERAADYVPGDRFGGFEGRTALYAPTTEGKL